MIIMILITDILCWLPVVS